MQNEIEATEGEDTDLSETLEGNSFEKTSGSPPVSPKKKDTEEQRLEKAFELFTGCSNQALNDVCQFYGNMTAAKLRNCNDSVHCAFQNYVNYGHILKRE